jgi:DNA-binding response OmpR family regulator
MKSKFTAVEWLQKALSIHFSLDQKMQFEGLFQQALEMERSQMFPCPESGFEVVIDRCSIINNGVETFLPKKMVYLAYYLSTNSGKFVTRESILDNVWPGVCVEDRTVDVHIWKLREIFPSIPIKTHKGVGYGWISDN